MNLMVYGSALRIGIYMMQEVFRILGFKQTKEDIEVVRQTIDCLHKEHVLRRYTNVATDLKYDGGIVDTFLHHQDRSYSVKEVFQFIHNSELDFLNWANPSEYSLEISVPALHPLWSKIDNNRLQRYDQYHINDLLTQHRGTHRWFCSHPNYANKCRITFDRNDFINYTIYLHRSAKVKSGSDVNKKNTALMTRSNWDTVYQFELSHDLSVVIKIIANGQKTVGDVINILSEMTCEREAMIKRLLPEIKSLYERGHIYVLLPEEK